MEGGEMQRVYKVEMEIEGLAAMFTRPNPCVGTFVLDGNKRDQRWR
jgi:hypothetical protein